MEFVEGKKSRCPLINYLCDRFSLLLYFETILKNGISFLPVSFKGLYLAKKLPTLLRLDKAAAIKTSGYQGYRRKSR